jgi:small-conductance mechanosensitive channel
MKKHEKAILIILVVLLALAVGGVSLTRGWSDYRAQMRAMRLASNQSTELVDTHSLDTAQQLEPLAVTRPERDYANQVLTLGDHSVDLAFAAAMHDATESPAAMTPQARQLSATVKTEQEAVAADQNRVTQFTQAMAKLPDSEKGPLQELLGIAQAQLLLDQDDLEDAHQDLIRTGADKQARIQQLLAQHDASEAHAAVTNAKVSATAGETAPSIELTKSKNILAQGEAWMSLRDKEKLLLQAEKDAQARAVRLSASHDAIQKQMEDGQSGGSVSPTGTLQPAGQTQSASAPSQESSVSILQRLTADKKNLADLNKRVETELQLAAVYSSWAGFVNARAKAFLHGIFMSLCWVFLIALCVYGLNFWLQRVFAQMAVDHRQMHTIHSLILFSLQALGLVLILLVIFGLPSNFATVLALAGAGLTVAMKDFIVGFFGWFVLMGKDGIRVGDWVEINGVGGEVVSLGLLHTVLLETGNWTDAGHPTGRQVSFVNSFAIEGHYFNFSTSGQWLWDEIDVQVPENAEPYTTAEAIQKIAADETAANAKLAEEEWNRAAPSSANRSFSAAPSLSVRPTGAGVNVVLRYITRANERYETRARIYRGVVDLLHQKKIPESAASTPPSTPPPTPTPAPVPNRA